MVLTDRSNAIIVVNSIFPFIAFFAVALRFYARKLKASAFMADDYFIILSLIFMMGNSMPFIYCATNGGMGQPIATLTPDEITVTFWTQFPYIWSISCIKLSILLLYRRIFTTPKFRIAVNVVGVIVILWTIAFFFASVFQAWPISYNWDPFQPATTIDEVTMYLALASSEMILDVIVLSLPWAVIWRLKMTTARKWTVIGIFMLGGFVCISGALRIYYFVNVKLSINVDFTYDTYNVFIWTAIEPCVGIVCACLPNLGPIFQKGHAPESMLGSFRNYLRLRTRSRQSKSGGSTDWSHGSAKITTEGSSSTKSLYRVPEESMVLTSIKGNHVSEEERDGMAPEKIMVNTLISTKQDRSKE